MSPRLVGWAAVFDSPSDGLPFIEYVRPGAFTRTLKDNATDVLALLHHKAELPLGRLGAGTLGLSVDERGLKFDVLLPDTSLGRDLAVSVERGDVRGASFAFTVAKDGQRWSEREGQIVRELLDVDPHDISITSTPAYKATMDVSLAMRSLEAWRATERPRLGRARRWLETCA